jgi:hypothetical protein
MALGCIAGCASAPGNPSPQAATVPTIRIDGRSYDCAGLAVFDAAAAPPVDVQLFGSWTDAGYEQIATLIQQCAATHGQGGQRVMQRRLALIPGVRTAVSAEKIRRAAAVGARTS